MSLCEVMLWLGCDAKPVLSMHCVFSFTWFLFFSWMILPDIPLIFTRQNPLCFPTFYFDPQPPHPPLFFKNFSQPSQLFSFLAALWQRCLSVLGTWYLCLRSQSTWLQPERPPLSWEVAVTACTQHPVSALLPQPPSTCAGVHRREAGGEARRAVLISAVEDRIAFSAFLPHQPFRLSSTCP